MITRTITIYQYLMDTLTTRIERANRSAARMGQPGYTITTQPTDPEPVYDEGMISHWHRDSEGRPDYPLDREGNRIYPEYYRPRVIATIYGEAPKLPGGWEFVGIVDEDPIAGPQPRMITDFGRRLDVNLDTYRDRDTWSDCDHCGTRRNHTRVFLLHSTESGALARVGSSCISAFLGIDVVIPEPHAIGVFETIEEIETFPWNFCPTDQAFRIRDVLALSYAMVQTFGWMSAAKARDTRNAVSTGERVYCLMTAKGMQAHDERRDMIDSVASDIVDALVAYATDLRNTDISEYARSVSALMTSPDGPLQYVTGRNLRLLTSVVAGYQRELSRNAQAVASADSVHVGTINERSTWTLTVTSAMIFDNEYGSKQLVKFADSDGNVFIWWNSGSADPKVGVSYSVTGRIKAHDEYAGIKQTVLTRCKIVDV